MLDKVVFKKSIFQLNLIFHYISHLFLNSAIIDVGSITNASDILRKGPK